MVAQREKPVDIGRQPSDSSVRRLYIILEHAPLELMQVLFLSPCPRPPLFTPAPLPPTSFPLPSTILFASLFWFSWFVEYHLSRCFAYQIGRRRCELADCLKHSHILSKQKKDPSIYRPDIVHQVCLSLYSLGLDPTHHINPL